MAGPAPVVLDHAPGALTGLVRLALPSVPGLNRLPGVRKSPGGFSPLSFELPPQVADPARVDAYARVCGFARRDTLPVTYPHLLGFGLHAAIMASPDYPWPAMGSVHLANAITSHRPIGRSEELVVSAELGQPTTHPKGTLLDFRTRVHADGELVWESTSSYLRRASTAQRAGGEAGTGAHAAPDTPDDTAPLGLPWRLPADLGRRYAAVSGDANPIHLTALTARALGFPRQIAHGMWSKARCLAAVENRLPEAFRVDVEFRKPILLPSTVWWRHEGSGDAQEFRLRRGDGRDHLLGRISAA